LRVPVALLVAGLLWYGFFPQTFAKFITPKFTSVLSTNAGR
jgi:hypothetical protein